MIGFEAPILAIADFRGADPETFDANLMEGFIAATILFGERTTHIRAASIDPDQLDARLFFGPGFSIDALLLGRAKF